MGSFDNKISFIAGVSQKNLDGPFYKLILCVMGDNKHFFETPVLNVRNYHPNEAFTDILGNINRLRPEKIGKGSHRDALRTYINECRLGISEEKRTYNLIPNSDGFDLVPNKR